MSFFRLTVKDAEGETDSITATVTVNAGIRFDLLNVYVGHAKSLIS